MNAKKAKLLRRQARETSYARVDGYKEIIHRERLVKTGNLNPDGTPQLARYTPITLVNAPYGFRAVYRNLKKEAK